MEGTYKRNMVKVNCKTVLLQKDEGYKLDSGQIMSRPIADRSSAGVYESKVVF